MQEPLEPHPMPFVRLWGESDTNDFENVVYKFPSLPGIVHPLMSHDKLYTQDHIGGLQ